MVKRITAINLLRPRIKSQGMTDLEILAGRLARQSTTFDEDEMWGIFRKLIKEIMFSLENGETVKLDDLIYISPNMKVGGEVGLSIRVDRSATASLNDPALWTGDKVKNHANMSKSSDELVSMWNEENPDDLVEE